MEGERRGPRRNSTLGTFLIMEILSLLLEVVLTQTHNYLGKNHHPSKRNIQKEIFFSDRKIDIIKIHIKVNENKINMNITALYILNCM